ncbi:MAG: hypothetical protein ACREHD_23695 [Pirellulales bacterium]
MDRMNVAARHEDVVRQCPSLCPVDRDKTSAAPPSPLNFQESYEIAFAGFTSAGPAADIIVTRHEHHRPSVFPPDMNRRPLATQHTASDTPGAKTNSSIPPTGGAGDKKWQIDEASGVPTPVIRANMISFRRSYPGPVKVTFFEQD